MNEDPVFTHKILFHPYTGVTGLLYAGVTGSLYAGVTGQH